MSDHARIGPPLLIFTGPTGAGGKTKRIGGQSGRTSSGRIGTKSPPSAPRPCSQITLCCGDGPVSRSMVSSMAASGTAGHYARTPAGAASAAPPVFDQPVGPQSTASASSPAPATILLLGKDAANGAPDATETGTSNPPNEHG